MKTGQFYKVVGFDGFFHIVMQSIFLFSIIIVFTSYNGNAQVPVPLGHGVRTHGIIMAMDYDSVNNRLYAGGYFENIGGLEANNIAMWDGTQWHTLGSGITGEVFTIKCLNGKVYVGGYFENAGGVIVKNIAMWDGLIWHKLGSTPVTNSYNFSLEAYKNDIYIASLLNLTSPPAVGVAKWDGSVWTLIATTDTANAVIKLSNINDSLLIYGRFSKLNGQPILNAAKYTGSSIIDFSVTLSASNATLVSAVGYENSIYALESTGKLYHVDTLGWIQGNKVTDLAQLLFVFKDSLYTLHEPSSPGGYDTLQIWNIYNGTKFSKISNTIYNDYGISIKAALTYNGNLLIGGMFSNIKNKSILNSAIFDGIKWTQFAGAAVVYYDGWINADIFTFAHDSSTGDLYAGGSFYFAGNKIAFNVARWNGTAWFPVGKGLNGNVRKLIFYHDTLYAGGSFTFSGNNQVARFAKFNGTDWEQIGNGADGSVYDMLVFNNELYVCGRFNNINGIVAHYVVKYNGNQWTKINNNKLDDVVVSLEIYDGKVNAAAEYGFTFGIFPNYIYSGVASLSGNTWSALVPNSYDDFDMILNYNNTLYGTSFGDVYYLNGTVWTSTGLALWPPDYVKLLIINNKLFATVSNDGMYEYDAGIWNRFQDFIQAYAVHQVDSTHLILGGFFPHFFDGYNNITLYNAGTLEMAKPHAIIQQDQDTICDHQYVLFTTPGSTFPTTYEWLFPGGTPSSSNVQLPYIKYSFPGDYDVFLKETNKFGSDSIYKLQAVHVNLCSAGISESIVVNKLQVFPNPASTEIYLKCDQPITSLQLINFKGQSCHVKNVRLNQDLIVIDSSDLMSGLYMIVINTKDEVYTEKIVVVNQK